MTDPQETNKARAVFGGILFLLGSWGGLALAGLVLGFDYLLHGEPAERGHLEQERDRRRRDRYADALAWLEADRLDRLRTNKALRDWFVADPATRGDRPNRGESFGRALARAWNNLLVGGHRFHSGWQQGRGDARTRREAGNDGWWKPTRPRPETPEAGAPEPDSTPLQEPESKNGWTVTWECPGCGRDMSAPAGQERSADDRYCPACRGRKPTEPKPDPNEPVDAEIIPDPPEPQHEVVPVGADEPATGPNADGYRERLDDLHGEVTQTRNTRSDHPSPPLSALR